MQTRHLHNPNKTYSGIYRLDDARVGVWSQNVSIAVQA
jgi:hypothetical protein